MDTEYKNKKQTFINYNNPLRIPNKISSYFPHYILLIVIISRNRGILVQNRNYTYSLLKTSQNTYIILTVISKWKSTFSLTTKSPKSISASPKFARAFSQFCSVIAWLGRYSFSPCKTQIHLITLENMQNIPTEDLINELERRVDCSKRRGVRTILIGMFLYYFLTNRTSWLW